MTDDPIVLGGALLLGTLRTKQQAAKPPTLEEQMWAEKARERREWNAAVDQMRADRARERKASNGN